MILPVDYDSLSAIQRRAVREEYVRLQRGKCYYCDVLLSDDPPEHVISRSIQWSLFPPHFLKHPIHLQHNHETGMTEGAVHAYCNAVMWQYDGR